MIFSIIKCLGTPLVLDENTMRKKRGMFARVLVDIDMLSPLPDHLWVECSDFTFVAGVEYEWLPPFCSHCKVIGHELAQCRVLHDQGRAPVSPHKFSHKIIFDERDQGRTEVPKQRKEYRKKDPQPTHVEGCTDKLTINASSGAKAGSLLGHTALDKSGGVEDDFADMPSLEDTSDHESRQGLPTHTSDFPETGTLRNSPGLMQAKGSESHVPFDAHHVEVLTPVVVSPQLRPISPQREKSPVHTTNLPNWWSS